MVTNASIFRVSRAFLFQQRVDLALVGPTEDVAGPVIDRKAVVLLVPIVVLDLSGPGHRPDAVSEIGDVVDARVRRSPVQFATQPSRVWTVFCDLQAIGEQQTGRSRRRGSGSEPLGHSEIDQLLGQMVIFDPPIHRVVRVVGHQQGQSEAAQQALGRTLPLPVLLGDLDQLTDIGELLDRSPQVAAQQRPQPLRLLGNVGPPAAQAAQLPLDSLLLDLLGAKLDPQFGQCVLLVVAGRGRGCRDGLGGADGWLELAEIGDPIATGRFEQVVEPVEPATAFRPARLQSVDLCFEDGDPVTAVPGNLDAELGFRGP